jgi:uncharacterized phiE125 gp8 family phage protein
MGMLKLLTGPVEEPVAGSDVRTYLRMDSDEYDVVLDDYAVAARQAAEKWTRRSFVDTTWNYMIEDSEIMSDEVIKLPRPPLESITSIYTYDWAGTAHEQDPTTYVTDVYSEPGRVFLKIGRIWNVPRRQNNAMIFEYISGYGDAEDVPTDIKLAITETAAWWFNSGEITEVPQKVVERLQPYRVLWF